MKPVFGRDRKLDAEVKSGVGFSARLPFDLLIKSLTRGSPWRDLSEIRDRKQALALLESAYQQGYPKLSFRQGEKKRIPVKGPVVFLSNYPLGVLEVIALYSLVSQVRPDLRVATFPLLDKLLIDGVTQTQESLRGTGAGESVVKAPKDINTALMFYPAKGISRVEFGSLKDGSWRSGFVTFAESSGSVIVPLYLDIGPFLRFYSRALVFKPLNYLPGLARFVVNEPKQSFLRVGDPIAPECYANMQVSKRAKAKLFRKQLYRVGHNKPSLFRHSEQIEAPQGRSVLANELGKCQLLGQSPDGMKIYLYEYQQNDAVMREIGRLREESFRLIGEGTGEASDLDRFDPSYWHIILWDQSAHEIAGAYRLKPTAYVDRDALYTSTLFNYTASSRKVLDQGLELGRSFVQPKYWGSRSLDYLWIGIAAFLRSQPRYRYLLGAVSISNTFSQAAKELLILYYETYYGAAAPIAEGKRPFVVDQRARESLSGTFSGKDRKQAFVVLKQQLAEMSFGVPVLYKQYTALCGPGGVSFHGFNIDPDFKDCIDGLVVVDISRLLPAKRRRYGLEDYHVQKH